MLMLRQRNGLYPAALISTCNLGLTSYFFSSRLKIWLQVNESTLNPNPMRSQGFSEGIPSFYHPQGGNHPWITFLAISRLFLKLTVASIKMERRKTPQLKQKLINDRPMNGTELNLVELSFIWVVAQVSSSIGLEMANAQILLLHFSNVSQMAFLLCVFLTAIICFLIILN